MPVKKEKYTESELKDTWDYYRDIFEMKVVNNKIESATSKLEPVMPVNTGKENGKCYAQWGSGKKYYYECGNAKARERAKEKAAKQGRAVRAGGYKG